MKIPTTDNSNSGNKNKRCVFKDDKLSKTAKSYTHKVFFVFFNKNMHLGFCTVQILISHGSTPCLCKFALTFPEFNDTNDFLTTLSHTN